MNSRPVHALAPTLGEAAAGPGLAFPGSHGDEAPRAGGDRLDFVRRWEIGGG